MKILLVDHDQTLVKLLSTALLEKGYAIDVATDGEQGWIYGSTYTYDLILLEWSLPKLDGISLCQRFRAHGYDTPIILLTSRHGTHNQIRGLDAGADDYIYKPFDLEALLARIRALLRRINCGFFAILSWGDLQLNPDNRQVSYRSKNISLSTTEYSLLELFLRHQGEVLTIEDIIENLWSSSEYPAEATVRSHLRRLRHKLNLAGLPQNIIKTIRGHGYCLKPHPTTTTMPHGSSDLEQLALMPGIISSWKKYRHNRQQQLIRLEQAMARLHTIKVELSNYRLWGAIAAHNLSRNLQLLDFNQGAELARDLEQLLHAQSTDAAATWVQLFGELQSLHQQISQSQQPYTGIAAQSKNSWLFLIISQDSHFNQSLIQIASVQQIHTYILPTANAAKVWLQTQQSQNQPLPNVILFNLKSTSILDSTVIGEFNSLVPATLVIAMGNLSKPGKANQDLESWQERLRVAQQGKCFYFTHPVNPDRIIAFAQQILKRRQEKKVMIVDDDVELLKSLPTLLQPWGLKLTTLDDPRQFWNVLQAVSPDLLVLNLELPSISAIELFKALRTHWYWYKLPVLCLVDQCRDRPLLSEINLSGTYALQGKPVSIAQLTHHIFNLLEQKD